MVFQGGVHGNVASGLMFPCELNAEKILKKVIKMRFS